MSMSVFWFLIAAVMMATGLLHAVGVFYSSAASITATVWMVGAILLLWLGSNKGGQEK